MTNSLAAAPKRRFRLKDPLLDDIYQRVDDKIYQEHIVRPFVYECENGVHIMRVTNASGEQWQFVRHEGSPQIKCMRKPMSDSQWETLPPVDDNASLRNMAGYFAKEDTPVMWPIKKAHSPQTRRDILSLVSTLLTKEFQQLCTSHPQYRTNPDLRKKMLQMELVLAKKWKGCYFRISTASYRAAVRNWWLHFVDRSLFKMWVSVIGAQQHNILSWKTFALFSCCSDLDVIVQNVQQLGPERRLLDDVVWSKWKGATAHDLLPAAWAVHWPVVRTWPASVQSSVVEHLRANLHFHKQFQVFWPQEHTIAPAQKATPSELCAAFAAVQVEKKRWSPRELDMVMHVLLHLTKTPDLLPSNAPLATTAVAHFCDVWKSVYPSAFRNWSTDARTKWVQQCASVVKTSVEKGHFCFPRSLEDLSDHQSKSDLLMLRVALKNAAPALSHKKKRM